MMGGEIVFEKEASHENNNSNNICISEYRGLKDEKVSTEVPLFLVAYHKAQRDTYFRSIEDSRVRSETEYVQAATFTQEIEGSWKATHYASRFDTWPEQERANAFAVEECESKHGEHPNTYNLNAVNGGVMQINKAVWSDFFWREYGWSWEQVVLDDAINHIAAHIIWERAGGSWYPWACRYNLE